MSYRYYPPQSPVSSANESPLPEPPIDIDTDCHVATTDDWAYRDDFPCYPDLCKQPVAAPLPLNLSLAMGYAWSPHAKKFQPLYPQPALPVAHATSQQDMDDPDSYHYHCFPPTAKQEPFPDLYSHPFGTFRPILDPGSPIGPTHPHTAPVDTSALDLGFQYPPSHVPVSLPLLSAPVPRHPAYFATSLVHNGERTCQEQEQQQDRHALRVLTQGLQEQPTVSPAEVSPVISFADLPEGGDEDADGEPDIDPLYLHQDGHSTLCQYGYAPSFIRGSPSGTPGSHAMDAESAHPDYDYTPAEDDDDDGDFDPTTSKNTRTLRPRALAGRNSARYHPYVSSPAVKHSPRSPLISPSHVSPSSSGQPARTRKNTRTLPVPVPVPNLTKKSRGRRVPTVNGTIIGRGQRDAALGARIYLCDVSGCGKCFARGEHLKRHIRSIHTYEKPHKCPYPGCGKEFSRHDNLGQHMKVHKDLSKVVERTRSGET